MSDKDEPINMDRAAEVLYAQERYQHEPVAAAPPAPAGAAEPTKPVAVVAPASPARAVELARLATAVLAIALAAAFFYPAFHDALHRDAPLLAPARAAPGPQRPAALVVYLSIDAKPRGATVFVDGVERGTSPLLTNVTCFAGEPIKVAVAAPGYLRWSADLVCARGPTTTLTPVLVRDR